MQNYRKARSHGSKHLITVVLISLIMVGIAVYFSVLKNNEENNDSPDHSVNNSAVNIGDTTGDTPPSDKKNPDDRDSDDSVADVPPSNDLDQPVNTEISEPDNTSPEFTWPCDSMNIGQEYSGLIPVFSETLQDWRAHPAIDIVTIEAENVYAAADGIVEDVYTDGLMGNTVLIKHSDNLYTLYQSLADNPKVLKNMEVKKGDLIGKTGEAPSEETLGKHLHFAMIESGNNHDPSTYFKTETETSGKMPSDQSAV